ncbi:MAG: STAS domain-containing protein [Bacteriovoracia bacterium]
MKTLIQKTQDGLVISLQGKLDFETTDTFKLDLERILDVGSESQLIFDFSDLQFVGSSGIIPFIQLLKDFNKKTERKPVYMNVRSEFRKMITASDTEGSFAFDDLSKVSRSGIPPKLPRIDQ